VAQRLFQGDVVGQQAPRLLVNFGDGAVVPVPPDALLAEEPATFDRLVRLRDYARAHPELQVPADLLL